LVLSPSNARNATNICTCCGCCCQILKNLKTLPKPADCVLTNYYAELDADLCIGCEICVERCQMDAIRMEDGHALIDRDRCIGCGLCVTTCDVQAIRLMAKEQEERREPPERLSDMHLRIMKERRKQAQTD
jgi:Na+-translocating ferredoxin:NAD+ oxidoreductase RNF subunit RnfB